MKKILIRLIMSPFVLIAGLILTLDWILFGLRDYKHKSIPYLISRLSRKVIVG